MGETSGTGVAFTRNPSTGEKKLYGEYLLNAQGEDCLLYTSMLSGVVSLGAGLFAALFPGVLMKSVTLAIGLWLSLIHIS